MTNQENQGNPWRQRKSVRRDVRTPSATIIAQINDIEDEYVVAPLPEPVLLSRATDPELGRVLRQWSDAAVWVIGAALQPRQHDQGLEQARGRLRRYKPVLTQKSV